MSMQFDGNWCLSGIGLLLVHLHGHLEKLPGARRKFWCVPLSPGLICSGVAW